MKIFKITGEGKTAAFEDAETKEIVIPSKTYYKIETNQEAVEFLKNSGGSTVDRIKYFILHLYNAGAYPLGEKDMFAMIRNADAEREELILSILEMCTSKYKDCCFKILDEVAPLFQDEFYTKQELLEKEKSKLKES